MMEAKNKLNKRTLQKINKEKRLKRKSGLTQKWHSAVNFIEGIHYYKIMRRSDVLKILFVCMCVRQVCPSETCGDNPRIKADTVLRTLGVPPGQTMAYLKERQPQNYEKLVSDYNDFLDCIRMVHVGYFKRSGAQNEASFKNRLQNTETDEQFKNNYVQTLRQLYDFRQNRQDMTRDNFDSILDTTADTYDVPFVSLDQLSGVVKRLLRGKRSDSHIKERSPSTVV